MAISRAQLVKELEPGLKCTIRAWNTNDTPDQTKLRFL